MRRRCCSAEKTATVAIRVEVSLIATISRLGPSRRAARGMRSHTGAVERCGGSHRFGILSARSATSVAGGRYRRAPLLERPPKGILRISGSGQVETLRVSGSCTHKLLTAEMAKICFYQERQLRPRSLMSVSRPSRSFLGRMASPECGRSFTAAGDPSCGERANPDRQFCPQARRE